MAASLPVVITISCVGGALAVSASVLIFVVVHRRRRNTCCGAEFGSIGCNPRCDHLGIGSSYGGTKAPSDAHSLHPVKRASSDYNRSPGTNSAREETSRFHDGGSKRFEGDSRSQALPPLRPLAPSYTSKPTLSNSQRPRSSKQGEALPLRPRAEAQDVPDTLSSKPRNPRLSSERSKNTSQSNWFWPQPDLQGSAKADTDLVRPFGHLPSLDITRNAGSMLSGIPQLDEKSSIRLSLSHPHIGDAPIGALPAPPQGHPAFSRTRNSLSARPKSPRSLSMESLISGSSSVLRSSGSPVSRRKRSATDAGYSTISPVHIDDEKIPVELLDDSRAQPHSSLARDLTTLFQPRGDSITQQPESTTQPSHRAEGQKWLMGSEGSAFSMTLLSAPSLNVAGAPASAESRKTRTNTNTKKSIARLCEPLEAPIVLTPSPQRPRPVHVLEQAANEASSEASTPAEKLVPRPLQAKHLAKDLPQLPHDRRPQAVQRPMVHLPSPPQDRSLPIQGRRGVGRRSPKRAGSSPNRRPRTAGDASPRSNGSSSHHNPSTRASSTRQARPHRATIGGSALPTGLREHAAARTASANHPGRPPPYTAPPPPVPPFARAASLDHPGRPPPYAAPPPPMPPAAVDAPFYCLPARVPDFNPRISIPHELISDMSSTSMPNSDKPASSAPVSAHAARPTHWSASSSNSNSSTSTAEPSLSAEFGVGRPLDLGLGLAARFDTSLAAGLSFSPASSPCPSPPLRSPLRLTALGPTSAADAPNGAHAQPAQGLRRMGPSTIPAAGLPGGWASSGNNYVADGHF